MEVTLALVQYKGFPPPPPPKYLFQIKLLLLERGLTLYCSASGLVHQFELFYLF